MFACHVYNICYGIYCCEYLSLTCHFTVRISGSKLRKIIIRDFYPGPDLKMKNSSFETFWMHFLILVFKTFPIMKEEAGIPKIFSKILSRKHESKPKLIKNASNSAPWKKTPCLFELNRYGVGSNVMTWNLYLREHSVRRLLIWNKKCADKILNHYHTES